MKKFTKLIFLSVLLCFSTTIIFAQQEILQSDTAKMVVSLISDMILLSIAKHYLRLNLY